MPPRKRVPVVGVSPEQQETPIQRQWRLARGSARERLEVAQDPNLDKEVYGFLRARSSHTYPFILDALNCSPHVFDYVPHGSLPGRYVQSNPASNAEDYVNAASNDALGDGKLPDEMEKVLLDRELYGQLAKRPISKETIAALIQQDNRVYAVLKNPHVPDDVKVSFLDTADSGHAVLSSSIFLTTVGGPDVLRKVYEKVGGGLSPFYKGRLLENSDMPPDLFEKLVAEHTPPLQHRFIGLNALMKNHWNDASAATIRAAVAMDPECFVTFIDNDNLPEDLVDEHFDTLSTQDRASLMRNDKLGHKHVGVLMRTEAGQRAIAEYDHRHTYQTQSKDRWTLTDKERISLHKKLGYFPISPGAGQSYADYLVSQVSPLSPGSSEYDMFLRNNPQHAVKVLGGIKKRIEEGPASAAVKGDLIEEVMGDTAKLLLGWSNTADRAKDDDWGDEGVRILEAVHGRGKEAKASLQAPSIYSHRKLAKEAVDPKVQKWMLDHGSQEMHENLAQNPYLHPDVYNGLMKVATGLHIPYHLAMNPSITPEGEKQFIADDEHFQALAKVPTLSVPTQIQLNSKLPEDEWVDWVERESAHGKLHPETAKSIEARVLTQATSKEHKKRDSARLAMGTLLTARDCDPEVIYRAMKEPKLVGFWHEISRSRLDGIASQIKKDGPAKVMEMLQDKTSPPGAVALAGYWTDKGGHFLAGSQFGALPAHAKGAAVAGLLRSYENDGPLDVRLDKDTTHITPQVVAEEIGKGPGNYPPVLLAHKSVSSSTIEEALLHHPEAVVGAYLEAGYNYNSNEAAQKLAEKVSPEFARRIWSDPNYGVQAHSQGSSLYELLGKATVTAHAKTPEHIEEYLRSGQGGSRTTKLLELFGDNTHQPRKLPWSDDHLAELAHSISSHARNNDSMEALAGLMKPHIADKAIWGAYEGMLKPGLNEQEKLGAAIRFANAINSCAQVASPELIEDLKTVNVANIVQSHGYEPWKEIRNNIHKASFMNNPDQEAEGHVSPRFGVAKLRAARDLILSRSVTELPPKEMPAGDWSVGRLPNGNISSDKLQQAIDSRQVQKYGWARKQWTGAQRHSDSSQQVFLLNVTNEHIRKLHQAGLLDIFRKMHAHAWQSGHPAPEHHGIGWVRWTGDEKDGIFMDEVQTDIGQSLENRIATSIRNAANNYGFVAAEKEAADIEREMPAHKRKEVNKILFGDVYPGEIIAESFHQWLRDQGHHETPVHIHSVVSAAPGRLVENLKPLCGTCGKAVEEHVHKFRPDIRIPNRPIGCKGCGKPEEKHQSLIADHEYEDTGPPNRLDAPAHYNKTYHDTPIKMAKEPRRYGDLPTQTSTKAQGRPTWGGPVRKSEKDADGIAKLLNVDNPLDRKLALRSVGVEPYHLRIALSDPDPDVRHAAALHPSLTPELRREVLAGDDVWLAERVLGRPDLTPGDLEVAMGRPELLPTAARHRALTADQKKRLLADPKTAEGVVADLRKNIGYITYPLLGEAGPRTTSYITSHYNQLVRNAPKGERGTTEYNTHMYPNWTLPEDHRYMTSRVDVKPGTFDKDVRGRLFGPETDPGKVAGQKDKVLQVMSGKNSNAVDLHESQHMIYGRLRQRLGSIAVNKLLAHAWDSVDPNDAAAVGKIFGSLSPKVRPGDEHEEKVAWLANYLMDPAIRRRSHIHLKISDDKAAQKDMHESAKRVWRGLQRHGTKVRPEDVGAELAKDEDLIWNWVKELKDGDTVNTDFVSDHAGVNAFHQALFSAAEFFGKKVDPAIFRARLHDTDDPVSAVLAAAGLEESDRKDLEAIVQMKEMTKSLSAKDVKVTAALPGQSEFVEPLQEAFSREKVVPVHFGGKHSSGMLIATDDDGAQYLVKPGSGKQSPAKGAREEPSSQSRREVAFWRLALSLGLGAYLPRAELLSIDNKETAVFSMLSLEWQGLHRLTSKDPNAAHSILRKYLDSGALHKWAVLDWVAGNPDRHGNNLMVGPAPERRVALIDHGSAFAGPSFDPPNDRNSFVPYYLRLWAPQKWSILSPEDKAKVMPRLTVGMDDEFRAWVESIDPDKLAKVLHTVGIDTTACLERLSKLNEAVAGSENASEAVNLLWVK